MHTKQRPDEMKLNQYRNVVETIWHTLPNHHLVALDTFQIIPNHVHFILQLSGAPRRAPMLGVIVGLFKSECTKYIRKISGNPHMIVWQRNYYEHIILTDHDLNKIREYILTNPVLWERDRNNILC